MEVLQLFEIEQVLKRAEELQTSLPNIILDEIKQILKNE